MTVPMVNHSRRKLLVMSKDLLFRNVVWNDMFYNLFGWADLDDLLVILVHNLLRYSDNVQDVFVMVML